jgi:acyl carrier protein
LDRPYVAPRTPVEEELAQIWRELLGVDRVGIHDNFFELGGHSLLLTQLASRVSEAFQVDVPLRVLFDTPTIDEITVAIAERLIEHESSEELSQLLDNLEELTPADAASMLAAEA